MNNTNALRVVGWGFGFVLLALAAATVWRWTGRSIWVDEGALLKNLVEAKSFADLFFPWPYYDQAQPTFVSVMHTWVLSLSEEIQIIRMAVAIVSISLSSIVFYVFRGERVPFVLQAFVVIAFIGTLGFYYTEIKHYAFEIAFSFIAIFFLYRYHRREMSVTAAIFFICLFSFMGFSTLIPAAILSVGLVVHELIRAGSKPIVMGLPLLVVSSSFLLVGYFHMKLLTEVQMTVDAYESLGFWEDTKTFIKAGLGAHGGKYAALAVAISIFLGVSGRRDSFQFFLSLLFVGILIVIFIGKIATVYPVIYSRHIVWLLPFSLVIITLSVKDGLWSRGWIARGLSVVVIALLVFQTNRVVALHVNGSFEGNTDNGLLYEFLASYPPSDVGVYPSARKTLEYYLRIRPVLEKHVYFGLLDVGSGDLRDLKETVKEAVKDGFLSIENTERLYIISHLQPIGLGLNKGGRQRREEAVVEVINESGCVFESLMTGRNVQILRLDCR